MTSRNKPCECPRSTSHHAGQWKYPDIILPLLGYILFLTCCWRSIWQYARPRSPSHTRSLLHFTASSTTTPVQTLESHRHSWTTGCWWEVFCWVFGWSGRVYVRASTKPIFSTTSTDDPAQHIDDNDEIDISALRCCCGLTRSHRGCDFLATNYWLRFTRLNFPFLYHLEFKEYDVLIL